MQDKDKKDKNNQNEDKFKNSDFFQDKQPSPFMKPYFIWILVFGIIVIMYMISKNYEQTLNIDYTQFVQLIEQGKIKNIVIYNDTGKVEGIIEEKGLNGKTYKRKFHTTRPIGDTEIYNLLRKKHIQTIVKETNTFLSNFFISVVPTLFIILFLWFLISRQMKGIGKGTMNFVRSRVRKWNKGESKVTFEDVAGIDEAKEEVQEIIEFLKNPSKFIKLGGRIPKGVLLMGPPGTGKTLLAKAIAGEADVPFFSISGSDFVEMFVGVGASRVRDLFEQGKKHAPCIIFIDEIDAVGRHRGAGIGGGHDEREQTLNAILVEMDGFNTEKGVIIIAATNRPDVLDPALLRPGRFDRQIVINLPDIEQREKILQVHTKKIKLAKDVDLKTIARGTAYFSGADLANLVNEAALLAARKGKEAVETEDLEEARDKVLWGRERRSLKIAEDDKRVTAYHEAGHTIISMMVEEAEPIHKVSIIPRGQALGMTMQLPQKDEFITRKKKLISEIQILYGGRIAEEIAFGEISTGASNDIKRASQLIRKMITQWGMSENLGPITYGEREEHIFLGKEISRQIDYSEATAVEIDKEVKRIATECYQKAKKILKDNEEKLHKLAQYLLKKEVLTAEEVKKILDGEEIELPQPKEEPEKNAEEQEKNEELNKKNE